MFHVLNRGNRRMSLFDKPEDYATCKWVILEAADHVEMRVLAYCTMPNHWHLVLRLR